MLTARESAALLMIITVEVSTLMLLSDRASARVGLQAEVMRVQLCDGSVVSLCYYLPLVRSVLAYACSVLGGFGLPGPLNGD